MNALFLTHSTTLQPFYGLMLALREPMHLDRVGFFVARYPNFNRFRLQHPDIESGRYSLLKEWEIADNGRIEREPDLALIRRYEEELGVPNLWGALVADRRVYLGRRATFTQDYGARFDHRQMLNLLEAGLVAMERLFDEVEPDFVASFICVTLSQYLGYLFARSRGVKVLNLRPTRIKNYVTYGESIFEPSERIGESYRRYLSCEGEDGWVREAREFVETTESHDPRYEGAFIRPPRGGRRKVFSIGRLPGAIARSLRAEYGHRFGPVKDNHTPGILVPALYNHLVKPARRRWMGWRLASDYVKGDELGSFDYVFFPMHTEPENTLLVFGRPYMNQIEAIRNVSQSIPVGMTLLVKEHPASVGKRHFNYYRKILDIPNVRLADPALPTGPILEKAALVATIAGSVGWEAVLQRRPVVALGQTPYEHLPSSMVRRVTDLDRLGHEIADLMRSYRFDEDAMVAYVAATLRESAPVNFYSTLMGRTVYVGEDGQTDGDEAWRSNIDELARYTVRMVTDECRGP